MENKINPEDLLLLQRESLIQYEQPIEVEMQNNNQQMHNKNDLQSGKGMKQQSVEQRPSVEDILNQILAPREWIENSKKYIQYVSQNASSREDVAKLQKLLDERLLYRQARESGICAIREELHSQCFDEIIRQVTINCQERGLLLMRVKDELKMTIAAYQTLYNSSVSFGMRKQLQAEQNKDQLEDRINQLEATKKNLEEQKQELTNKLSAIEKRISERKLVDENKMKQEIEYLNYQFHHLEQYLTSIKPLK